MDSRYFAALSISSFDSDEQINGFSDYGSNVTQTELYHQLSYIEEISSNFFAKRPLSLQRDCGAFAEIEPKLHQEFEFRLSDNVNDDILSVTVVCIPDFVWKEDVSVMEKEKVCGIDFQSLKFKLFRKNIDTSVELPIKAVLFNGEYCITLSKAHGLRAGHYVLSVSLDDLKMSDFRESVQTVRVTYSVHSAVRAVPIETDKHLCDEVFSNEFKYYRYVLQDHTKVLRVSCRALSSEDGDGAADVSDPDLYVSNRCEGLIGVTRDCEGYVWRSVNVGSDSIDIFPGDLHLQRGVGPTESSVFIIGVMGYREVNRFELLVTLTDAAPVTQLTLQPLESRNGSNSPNSVRRFSVSGGASYAMQVDVASRSSIVAVLQLPSTASHSYERSNCKTIMTEHHISRKRGRVVYVSDALENSGEQRNTNENALTVTIFLSSSTKNPRSSNHMWKTSAEVRPGDTTFSLAFVIDCDEWRYGRDVCYFAVSVESSKSSSPQQHFSLTVLSEEECAGLEEVQRRRCAVFYDLFADIDSSVLSQKDRSHQQNHKMTNRPASNSVRSAVPLDDQSLTYCEVEYVSFRQLLLEAGAVDGQVFYDLGCGCGKAVVGAALSGVRFLKCVGVEVLPTLAHCATEVVRYLQPTGTDQAPPHRKTTKSVGSTKYASNSLILADEGAGLSQTDVTLRQTVAALNLSLPLLEIRHDDMLDADWSDADLVFLSSLCFSDHLLQAALDRGSSLRQGARVVTLKLPERYEALYTLHDTIPAVKMSWGYATAYVLTRKPHQRCD